mgnify:CR=1 FL=1
MIASSEGEAKNNDPRSMQRVLVGSYLALDVMIYGAHRTGLQPLVIVGSIDYPMPPSAAFCDQMLQAGLQVVFVRRPGFGGTPGLPKAILGEEEIAKGASVAAEAAILCKLLVNLGLQDIVLMSLGTSTPVCARLAKLYPNVRLLICANPVFNQNIVQVFKPAWFQSLLGLIIRTKTGVRIAEVALKHQLRSDPLKFYREVLKNCPGDWAYAEANQADLLDACQLLLNVTPDTFFYDVRMALLPDPTLTDDYFASMNVVALSGLQTSDLWQTELDKEAERLSLPVVYAPEGDMLVPYVAPNTLLATIRAHTVTAAHAQA